MVSGYYKQDGRVNKFVVGLTVVAVVFFVFFVAVAAIVGTNYKQLGNFIKVYALVHSQYIEPTDTANLVDGATHGMVESLGDPYSIYLDAAMFKQLEDQIHGSFAGLGILVGLDKDAGSDKGLLTVKRVYKDTPAYRQGLKEGDRITAIDERDARGIDLDTAIKLMRGPVGSKVTLTVLHAGSAKPVRLELVRAEIRVPTVEGKMLSGSRIGHISITQFTEKTPGEMDSVLANLQKQEMNGLILDLRNNPGGELGSVTKVADNFVPQGPIVYVDYRSGAEEVRNADEQYLHLPLVVLVNENSASAAEILAGAIQDRKTGILVGTTTFGKGIVQTVFPLNSGAGEQAGLKLTTARYLTPGKHYINKKGIQPDVAVKDNPDLPGDEQLNRAETIIKEKISGQA